MQTVSQHPSDTPAAAWFCGSAALQMACLALAYGLCAWLAAADAAVAMANPELPAGPRPALVLWLPHGVVLSAMLLRSVHHWWKYSLTQGLCDGLLQLQIHVPQLALGLALVNCLEVLLCAALLRHLGGRRFVCASPREVLLFAGIAVLLVPALTAALACTLASPLASGGLPLRPWLALWLGHGMGMAWVWPCSHRCCWAACSARPRTCPQAQAQAGLPTGRSVAPWPACWCWS